MRQRPMLYSPPNQDGPYYRRWRAWGICTADGTMAELTMDPEEPILDTGPAPTDGPPGHLP